MARSADDQKKRLAELKKEVALRGLERYPSVLKTISELPLELQSPAVTTLADREQIQTIIIFPPQIQRGWHYVPKQALLFRATGVNHLLASIWPDQEPQVTCLNGHGLMYLQVTLMLLYGHLEIVAHGQDSPTRIGMEFNTVAWSYLSTPLQNLLESTRVHLRAPANQARYLSTAKNVPAELPLKFSNGIQIYGSLPGEQLEELVFQPALWKQWSYFFRRPVIANTLLLMTGNYVIVIREEVGISQGWILTYIPRECITEMQNQPYDMYNELIMRLKRSDQTAEYNLLLAKETVEAWQLHWMRHGGCWRDLSAHMVVN